ncbi:unnamed protein product [Ixodes persulcatus]
MRRPWIRDARTTKNDNVWEKSEAIDPQEEAVSTPPPPSSSSPGLPTLRRTTEPAGRDPVESSTDRAAEPRRHARRTAPTPSLAPARAWTARPGESVPGEIVIIGRAPPVLGHATVGHETGARIETDGPTI